MIAAASSGEKLDFAKKAGADYLVNYSDGDLKTKIKPLTNSKGADVIYDPDGTCTASVKDVKDMLGAAAKTLQSLSQYMNEAKALVSKYKSAHVKKES